MHIGEQVNGNLCIIGVVEGENMSLHDVNLYELYVPSTIDVNEKLSIKGNFKNEGGKNVTDLEVSYKIGENEKVIKPLAELDIAPGGKYTFTISDIEFEKEVNRIYQVEVSIEKVNGKIDDYPEDNTLQSDVRIWDAPDAPTIVSTAPSNKNVVLEEFTGINCQWCPAGHKIANEIKAANPGRVSVINIHTGIYANGTTPDFTTAYGAAIDSQAGTTGYPMGTVNRHLFAAGSGVTALDRSFFVRSSNEILRQASYVNIGVKTDLNEETRELIVDVELYYTAQGSAINMLNIALVQDSIIGPQVGASANYPAMGSDSRYQHNHMLRDLITGQWGDSIRQTASGTFVAKRYYYVVPEKVKDTPVNLDKIEIITFVAQGSQEIITGCSNKSIETGFSSPEVNNGITAYIADGYLYINSEVPVQSADVYAVSGQQVLSVSNIDHAISVAALSSGVYTVKLKTAEGYKIVKVIF